MTRKELEALGEAPPQRERESAQTPWWKRMPRDWVELSPKLELGGETSEVVHVELNGPLASSSREDVQGSACPCTDPKRLWTPDAPLPWVPEPTRSGLVGSVPGPA
jgi:hypothetical protein